MTTSVYTALAAALAETEPVAKVARVQSLAGDWQAGHLTVDDAAPTLAWGRPQRPDLVPPAKVEQRGVATAEGRARLIHAIVHIEFSAINLALDHAARFRDLPRQYIADWIGVAAEEAYHYTLLADRLTQLGHHYGDFSAHAGLCDMADKTADDPLARMALVPRLLEARGLDVTPAMQAKLRQAGDHTTADLLDIILHDEIGHVALGDRWYRHLCVERKLLPETTYRQLLDHYRAPRLQRPINEAARLAAGFSREELAELTG